MSKLGQVVESVENYNKFVLDQVKRARTDQKFGRDLLGRWNDTKAKIPVTRTPTGLPLPRLALPEIDEPGEIARFIFGEGLPGEFPYLNATYREMYLEPVRETESFEKNGNKTGKKITQPEEPTRLFSGLMLAEDTNERFHYLTRHQRTHRLSTAFDGPTLYGLDSDADGVFGKIGEGGVAIDTVEDMVRLYDGFDLGSPNFSASMTISGPAPMIMAMYIAAAKRRFGPKVVPKLRGTVQADIFKEVQAQNETIFPIEPSLRFLTDMVEFTTAKCRAGIRSRSAVITSARPARRRCNRLLIRYRTVLRTRKCSPRVESRSINSGRAFRSFSIADSTRSTSRSRACRAASGRSECATCFGAGPRAQLFKLHTQTSGRSLIAAEFKNNLTRTATELILSYMNATNSCHSNSADEPFTTPSEEWIRLAAHGQAILLEESGIFKHTMNMLSGSPGMKAVERAVEAAILEEFREIERLGRRARRG